MTIGWAPVPDTEISSFSFHCWSRWSKTLSPARKRLAANLRVRHAASGLVPMLLSAPV